MLECLSLWHIGGCMIHGQGEGRMAWTWGIGSATTYGGGLQVDPWKRYWGVVVLIRREFL